MYWLKAQIQDFSRKRTSSKDWILGRHACLGKDVLDLSNPPFPIVNTQKGRADYLLNVYKNPRLACKAYQVIPHLKVDVRSLILQQNSTSWMRTKSPRFIYMDSYSELTDQIFTHRKKGWSFCANYSDIDHSEKFKEIFSAEGLLPLEKIYSVYTEFFTWLRSRYGNIPIVFLHFPIKLEKREKFRQRYEVIRSAIEELAPKFAPFFNFVLDENIVHQPESKIEGLEEFPYHYNEATYAAFAHQIKTTGLFG